MQISFELIEAGLLTSGEQFSYIIIRAASSSSTSRFDTSNVSGLPSNQYASAYSTGRHNTHPSRRQDIESHPVQIRLETVTHTENLDPMDQDKYAASQEYAR